VYWYERAAAQQDAMALCNLGYAYEMGQGVQKDIVRAADLYLSAAIKGNEAAQCNIGNFYENGTGVKKDLKQAFNWYEAATRQNSARGWRCLGSLYEEGAGVEKDVAKAAEYYTKAANLGDKWGQYYTGIMYQNGRGVKADTTKAMDWYLKACEQGLAKAKNNYAWMCFVTNSNLIKAKQMAAESLREEPDNYHTMDTYAHLLFLEDKFEAAEDWQQKSLAKGGDQRSGYVEFYGDILFKMGKTSDALKYWKKAAKLPNPSALLAQKIAEKTYIAP